MRPAVEGVSREAGRHPERVVFRVALQGVVVAEGRELVGVAAAHQSVVAAHDGDLVLAVRAVEPIFVALGEELVVAVVALELVVVREGAALVGDALVAARAERDPVVVDLLAEVDNVVACVESKFYGAFAESSRRPCTSSS